MDDQPTAPNMRTFSLNSPEAYEALCPRSGRPWILAGSLPREPRWPHRPSPLLVFAENEDSAGEAIAEWLGHVEAGRIGKGGGGDRQ